MNCMRLKDSHKKPLLESEKPPTADQRGGYLWGRGAVVFSFLNNTILNISHNFPHPTFHLEDQYLVYLAIFMIFISLKTMYYHCIHE